MEKFIPYIAKVRRALYKGRCPSSRPYQVNERVNESVNASFKQRFTASFKWKPPMYWK